MPTTKADYKKVRDTRDAVLAAAATNFRDKGYAAVTLREIAKSAGLTTGSLYYHFKSKEDVVREVLDQGHIRVRLDVEQALADPNIEQDDESLIRCAMKAHMASLFGHDSLPAANIRIFSQVPEHVKKASLTTRRQYEALWRNLLENGISSGFLNPDFDIDLILPLMLGALNWALEWSDADEERCHAIVDQVVAMLEA